MIGFLHAFFNSQVPGSVASMSTLASVFRDYDRFTWGRYVLIHQSLDLADQHVYSLGTATIGLGWVMTFLVRVHTCLGWGSS